MQPSQKTLAILISKRAQAEADLSKYKNAVHLLADAEQLARNREAETQAALKEATVNKIKGAKDTSGAVRAAYTAAINDLSVADAELSAGNELVLKAQHDLTQAVAAVYRQAVEVSKAVAAVEQPGLVAAARAYAVALKRHKNLIVYARVASANSGLIVDPIADIVNSNNPLHLEIEELIKGEKLDSQTVSEQSLIDYKLGDA